MKAGQPLKSTPEPSRSTAHRAASHMIRVAVVQMAYLPAFEDSQDYLSEPLGHPDRTVSCLLPEGLHAAPPAILQPYKELRKRLRATYVKQLKLRVLQILKACKKWDVKLVVFPEYSIPPEMLSDIAAFAPEMVVVGGSHFVSYKVLDDELYEKLAYEPHDDLLQNSASPILYNGKLQDLVKKVHPAKPEVRIIKSGSEWAPVQLPEGMPGPMAVLICLDFLARGTLPHWELIAPQLRDCSFVAAPALTGKHTLDEFMSLARLDARRYKKPVLLANDAKYGGSTLIVDEGRVPDNRLFPEHAGYLEQDEEGLIVADIDFGTRPVGPSTSFEFTPEIHPFAAASFVYRGTESKYAQWVVEVSALLEVEGPSNLKKLKAFKAYVNDHVPEIPKTENARQRRLSRLMERLEEHSKIERVQQWTREVLLSEDVLPLPILRAALARGAAEVLEQWVSEKNLGEFGPVVKRLRDAWDKEKKDTWAPQFHTTARAVSNEVAGEAKHKTAQIQSAKVAAYEPIVHNKFEEALRQAVEFLQKEEFVEGKQRLEGIVAEIDGVINKGGLSDELVQQRERCRMYIGFATLNLQETAQAREMLLGLDAAILTEKAQLQWIAALVAVGEVERARASLPAKENVSDKLWPTWDEANQSVMLGEGKIPEGPLENEGIQLHAASVYLAQNNDKMAAKLALEVLQKDKLRGLNQAIATHTLQAALSNTVHDWPITPNPPAIRIDCKLEIREPIVQQLEASFRDVRKAMLPEATRQHWLKLEQAFRALTKDYDALATYGKETLDDFEEDEPSHPNFADRDRAFDVVQKGDIDEALRVLPADPHPWRRRADEIEILAHGERFEQALEKAIALQRDFPDRPSIEYALAELYAITRKHSEAAKHAERAFTALPGIGYRLLFVQSLIHVGKGNEAFELLQPHLDDERALMQRAIATTATLTERLPLAAKAWKRYAEKNRHDWTALVNLAQVQYRLHQLEDAAETSHDAFVRHGEALPANALYQCGVFQANGVKVESDRVSRIRAIEKKIHERFPKDLQAQEYRFQLLAKLGDIPADADPIDFNALVQKGTMFRQYGLSTLVEHLTSRRLFLERVSDAARMGALPIAKMLRLGNNDPATFLVTILERSDEEVKWLCPPISLMDEPPAAQLHDATLLVGQLELLLLLKLDLYEPLQKALGPNGHVAILSRTKDQILADAGALRTRARQEKLDFVEALIPKLEHWPEAKPEENVPIIDWPSDDDEIPELPQWKKGTVVHIHAYLRFLKQNGVLTKEELDHLEKELGLKGEPDVALPDPLPERMGFTVLLVEKLESAGLLEKVRREFRAQIVLAPGTLDHYRRQRNDLRVSLVAEQLADKAFEVVAGERIRVLRALPVNEVPPLREETPKHFDVLIRKPLQDVVAYKKAVLAETNCWRLTAEFFGTTSLGAPDFVSLLAWPDEEQRKNLVTLVRRGAARDITFPSLVRYLLREPKDADPKLRLLASLGFADAMGPDELLRLDKQYEGLDGAKPRRLLEAMEWMAHHPQHLAGDEARLRISHTYGAAVFDAFVATDRSEQESLRVLEQLFGRLERLGEKTKTDPLDQAFVYIASRMTEEVQSAWTPNEDKTHMRMDPNAAILRLWRSVKSWCEVNFVRRAALGRATRWLWTQLSEDNGGPPAAVALTFAVTLPEPSTEPDMSRFLLHPAIEATTILPSLWATNPFEKATFTKLVDEAKLRLVGGNPPLPGGRFYQINVKFPDKKDGIPVAVPIEAAFLRLSKDDKQTEKLIERIQLTQGVCDGLMYDFLERIAKYPDDLEVQRQYALYATNALFRLVQDDPSYLYRWQKGHWQDDRQISPLVFLLMILSEPNKALPEGVALHQILQDRANEEPGEEEQKGFWVKHRRAATGVLLVMASEMPGVFPPIGYVRHRIEESEYAEEISRALSTITDCEKHPIARVASQVYFLRVAASRRPYVERGGKKIDLRDELPSYLEGLLERVIADPPPDTMAFFEPALLRVCGAVIQRLALPDHTPLREGIFWTYRLFQWLCLQLEAISPDARLDGMRRLAALAPPVNNPHDILDPFGFGRNDLDHRLATVLHTLAHLHVLDLPERLDHTNMAAHTPALVSTPKIEQRLVELAQKSYQGPKLGAVFPDWHFPGNIPDMALYTLLQLNSARFADLSEESRVRRFETIPKNIAALDEERVGERILHELVLAAALNHAGNLTPKERQLIEAKVREMEESDESKRYRRMMVISFWSAGEAHLEAEAFTRVLEDVADPNLGRMLGAMFLMVANRAPGNLEAVVRTMSEGLAEKGADVALWVGRGLARVVNLGKPEARKMTRALLLRLAKEPPFRDDMRMRELLTMFNIRENPA